MAVAAAASQEVTAVIVEAEAAEVAVDAAVVVVDNKRRIKVRCRWEMKKNKIGVYTFCDQELRFFPT